MAMRVLADTSAVARLIEQLAGQIAADVCAPGEKHPWALIGLRSRGDVLAHRLARILGCADVGCLDFTLYRDDLHAAGPAAAAPVLQTTEIPFNIDDMNVVLVDDVLMTGRSVRAALQSLMDLGRPRRVWLSVLVDRGGRELPIAADHVALDVTGRPGRRRGDDAPAPALSPDETVCVYLTPTDDRDAIEVRRADAPEA